MTRESESHQKIQAQFDQLGMRVDQVLDLDKLRVNQVKGAFDEIREQISALRTQPGVPAQNTPDAGGVDQKALYTLQDRLNVLEGRLQNVTHERDALSPLVQANFAECKVLRGEISELQREGAKNLGISDVLARLRSDVDNLGQRVSHLQGEMSRPPVTHAIPPREPPLAPVGNSALAFSPFPLSEEERVIAAEICAPPTRVGKPYAAAQKPIFKLKRCLVCGNLPRRRVTR